MKKISFLFLSSMMAICSIFYSCNEGKKSTTSKSSDKIQTTGVIGSPDATTTIDGSQLPPPPPPFGGVMNEEVKDSKSWWPPRVVPPKGAPNVLLIMTD
ncbi:MAG: hypothetical protein WAT71_10100, partial [Ignavibacteria bacterium]